MRAYAQCTITKKALKLIPTIDYLYSEHYRIDNVLQDYFFLEIFNLAKKQELKKTSPSE